MAAAKMSDPGPKNFKERNTRSEIQARSKTQLEIQVSIENVPGNINPLSSKLCILRVQKPSQSFQVTIAQRLKRSPDPACYLPQSTHLLHPPPPHFPGPQPGGSLVLGQGRGLSLRAFYLIISLSPGTQITLQKTRQDHGVRSH
jgi:hypothetical protein